VLIDAGSGTETQQMVTMGATDGSPDTFDASLVREYAQHWFGDSVTPTTWSDVWLSEGWATYAQLLYTQSVAATGDAELDELLSRRSVTMRARYGPPGHPRPDEFGAGNVSYCAAAMLRKLHAALGDQAFFALGAAWVQDHRNTQQDRASFTAFVTKRTGRDFSALINRWLDAPAPA
jgi:aminopeptidase N